ncbi:MAG TPA: DsbA family oxidoreductase [Prolixibacteraceae bacterium]|jgi:protein disulfide-isomerase
MQNKMKVEIWSDVMCPFCYIGKRKFEAALHSLPQKEDVEVVWHSFQLNPKLKDQPEKDVYSYLAELKGQTREWSVMIHDNMTKAAKVIGLDYHFEKAKVANSFDAHRVIQLAKKYKMTDALEERFFKAYFTDGELISDHATLIRLATEAGLPKEEVIQVLETNQYANEVLADGAEASKLGAHGVPFFVIDRKYAVSGAQEPEVFKASLQKALQEFQPVKYTLP